MLIETVYRRQEGSGIMPQYVGQESRAYSMANISRSPFLTFPLADTRRAAF